MPWFGVRSVYLHHGRINNSGLYEERVVLFDAETAEAAMAKAEVEAADYIRDLDASAIDLLQTFQLFEQPGDGAEVFSLMRTSNLSPDAYVDNFFDTGDERQQSV